MEEDEILAQLNSTQQEQEPEDPILQQLNAVKKKSTPDLGPSDFLKQQQQLTEPGAEPLKQNTVKEKPGLINL